MPFPVEGTIIEKIVRRKKGQDLFFNLLLWPLDHECINQYCIKLDNGHVYNVGRFDYATYEVGMSGRFSAYSWGEDNWSPQMGLKGVAYMILVAVILAAAIVGPMILAAHFIAP